MQKVVEWEDDVVRSTIPLSEASENRDNVSLSLSMCECVNVRCVYDDGDDERYTLWKVERGE